MPNWKQRFWAKTKRSTGVARERDGKRLEARCLNWTAASDQDGYGVFRLPRSVSIAGATLGSLPRAPRVSYFLAFGPFPKKFEVDHVCRNVKCVEFTHLVLRGPSEHARISNSDKQQDRIITHED